MRLSKKFAAIAIAAGVALTASAALAYWTAGGSGSGDASTKEDISLTLTGNDVSDLVPGVSQNITGTVDVSDNVSNAWVDTITPVIDVVETVFNSGCEVDDFTLLPSNHDALIADGATGVAFGSIELTNDPLEDQSGCKDQALVLSFSSN